MPCLISFGALRSNGTNKNAAEHRREAFERELERKLKSDKLSVLYCWIILETEDPHTLRLKQTDKPVFDTFKQ